MATRRRWFRVQIPTALAVCTAVVLGWASPCWACSCAQASDAEHFERADVVFDGTVVEHRPGASPGDPTTWTFEVRSVQKGESTARQNIVSWPDEATCGYPFSVGERYQVFAYRSERGLETNICTGTRNLGTTSPYAPAGTETPAPAVTAEPSPNPTPKSPLPAVPTATTAPGVATPEPTSTPTPRPAAARPPDEPTGNGGRAVAGAVAAGTLTIGGAAALVWRRLLVR